MIKFSTFLLNLLLVLCCTLSFGQISFDSKLELEKAANKFFVAEQYDKAKPLYSQLLSLSALEPNYNYRFGVCVLFTEADPLKSLPYIEGGANTAGVDVEAFYFLGLAEQLTYNFDPAIANYQKAKNAGYTNDKVDLNKAIQECRNGKILYNSAIDFDPAQDKEVFEAEFYRPYDFRKLKGKVIPLPPSFKTKYDAKNLKGTVVFTPSRSQTLIYASYGEDGNNKKDLYRVNRLPNGEWALPQRLPDVINTPYDEDYAFFDEESSTLYFASKGHNTMGGYDIFRSAYSQEDNSWNAPVNLQHPINSPFDDFLYVSDPTGRVAFFTSKRGTEFGKLRVFKTLLYDPEQVVLSVVEGSFQDLTDSVYNYMTATVFDPVTNEVVGKFKSHSQTGKYLLILPPQNGYSVDIAPKEAGGFKFDLDVPQHDESKPLQQDLVFDTDGDEAVVTLTNFFDKAGKPDTLSLASTRSKQEVESKMVQMPDSTEILAAKAKEKKQEEAEKVAVLEELAAKEAAKLQAELAKRDSLARVKEAALLAEAERFKNEQARRDSIAEAEELAIQIEKARLDSIAEVEKQRALVFEREKQVQDSLAQAKKAAEELLAQQEKARLDSIAQANELAEKQRKLSEQAIADSLAKAEEFAMQVVKEKEQAKLDSIAELEKQLALAKEREKEVLDSIAMAEASAVELAIQQEQALADSVARAKQLAETAVNREVELADSIAKAEELAANLLLERQQFVEDSIAQIERVLAAVKQAEQDSLALVEKRAFERSIAKADSIAAAEALAAELARERRRFVADSLAELERVALEKAERAKQDSLYAANKKIVQDSLDLMALAAAEEKRLKEIEEEVERLKAKAIADSLGDQNVVINESEDFDALLVEMQEKEAEILENQTVSVVGKDSTLISAVTAANTVDPDTTDANEIVSEADLFLQRIADLEKQKQSQQAEVRAENERLAAEKQKQLNQAISLDSAYASIADSTNSIFALNNDSTIQKSDIVTPEGELDLELESVALKSDADPNEYLAALAAIEAQIEVDESTNSKTYELVELPVERDKYNDPQLDNILAEDRKALEAHKQIAAEKEAELKLQMQQDRETLDVVLANDQAEIEEVEAALLEDLSQNQKSRGNLKASVKEKKVAQVAEELIADETEQPLTKEEANLTAQVNAEEQALLNDADEVLETVFEEVSVVQENKEALTQQTEQIIEADTVANLDKVAEERGKEEIAEVSITEQVVEVGEVAKETTDEKLEKDIVAEAEEVIDEVLAKVDEDEVVSSSEQAKPNQLLNVDSNSKEENEELELDFSSSSIHLMEAALRDYTLQKSDFSAIENNSMRRMIKRMRAEDVGRIAVLKNMKNEWVEAGKSQDALKAIKANSRNQEVLANLVVPQSKEEKLANPYNADNAKKREGVYYKLGFTIVASNLSETVMEAMTPEQAMTFSMPEFSLASEYFETLADARAEMRYYKSKGFDRVKVLVFKGNEQIMLSDVENIPFVD